MGKYDDILYLPHHTSRRHPRMGQLERAAQFSPFAALTGYEAAVEETARYTDCQVELDEDRMAELDVRLRWLREHLDQAPKAAVTYFVPDERKAGGEYRTVSGVVRKIDLYHRTVLLDKETVVPIDAIRDLQLT